MYLQWKMLTYNSSLGSPHNYDRGNPTFEPFLQRHSNQYTSR